MAVLFDTAPLPPADRLEAFRTAMLDASGSTRIELDTAEGVRGQMALWSFGRARVFTAASTGISMSRDARAARVASTEAVAVAVHGGGTGRHVTAAGQRMVRTGDLMVVDITRPFEFSWSGQGSSTSIQVPITDLDLPPDAVQRAADRLATSPLYGMVSRHLVELTRHADSLSAGPMAAALGESTAHLVRALLVGTEDAGSGVRGGRRGHAGQPGAGLRPPAPARPGSGAGHGRRWPGCLAKTAVPGARAGRAQHRAVRHRAAVGGREGGACNRRRSSTNDCGLGEPVGVQGPHALLTPVQVGVRNAAEGLATPRCRTVSLTHRLPTRRTSPAVRSRHCSCSRHSETHTDSHRTDRRRRARAESYSLAERRHRPGARAVHGAARCVRIGCGSVEAADSCGQVHATQARVLLRADPGGHERGEQRCRAGPLRQATHRGDLRDRHPPGIDRR